MADRLAQAVLDALDEGLEIRLRRPAVPIAGADLEVVLETYLGDRRLSWTNIVSRDELLRGAGDPAIVVTVETGTRAIRNAPTDNLEEHRR